MPVENKPRKVGAEELSVRFGLDARDFPLGKEALKASFRNLRPEYFFPVSFADYEEGQGDFSFTNYLSLGSPAAAASAARAERWMAGKSGFPVRVWTAGFLRRAGLTAEHQDWYDGLLVNLAGRKIVTALDPVDTRPAEVYRYRFEPRGVASGVRFALEPGEALFIPAFCPHAVENDGAEETAALSFAFDVTAPLVDLFRGTVELCLGRPLPRVRTDSCFGARLWGGRERWDAWRGDAALPHPPILETIARELGREGLGEPALFTAPAARARLREEWTALLSDPARFRAGRLPNP